MKLSDDCWKCVSYYLDLKSLATLRRLNRAFYLALKDSTIVERAAAQSILKFRDQVTGGMVTYSSTNKALLNLIYRRYTWRGSVDSILIDKATASWNALSKSIGSKGDNFFISEGDLVDTVLIFGKNIRKVEWRISDMLYFTTYHLGTQFAVSRCPPLPVLSCRIWHSIYVTVYANSVFTAYERRIWCDYEHRVELRTDPDPVCITIGQNSFIIEKGYCKKQPLRE